MADVERFEFTGGDGQMLSARIHLPAVKPIACAVFAHCFTCSKDSRAATHISSALAEKGIATLRFDFTGLGESEGEFDGTTFSHNVSDIIAAASALREAYRAPALLIGHSLGGSAVLAAAAQIPEADGVATIGAPFEPKHVARLFDTSLEEIESNGQANVELGGRQFTIRKSFIEDLQQHCNAERIGEMKKALVVFHSPQDQVVGIDNARMIYQAARHPKSFISLDGADHLLRRRSDSRYVAEVLAAWASRYLPEEPADEPLDKGGTNLAPNPYELLLAALGACTSMTLKLYAGRKQWPLDAVRVTLRHDRVHAKDCEDCDKDTGMIDVIEKELELEGDLSDEQRERLLDIAARCPVHRTLLNEIKIRSELV
ncbi:MAG: OsmC family protein [Deltaproteobacteria bacterium]|nr:OsmC family protein [Deltaproteobacteria bacterium]